MLGSTGKLFPILCIFLFCVHDVLGWRRRIFPKGLDSDDVIEWSGMVPYKRGSSVLVIKSDHEELFRLQLQPFRRQMVINNLRTVENVEEIAPGKSFGLQITMGENNVYKIYIGHQFKQKTKKTRGDSHPPRIRFVKTSGIIKTAVLKKLGIKDFGARLNHDSCGRLGGDIKWDNMMERVCQSNQKLARIVRGESASPASLPWQAALRLKINYTNDDSPHICGASLINQCWAVSAAHCFRVTHSTSLNQRYIRVGDYFNDDSDFESNRRFSSYENVQDLPIEAVYKHEKYRVSYESDSKSFDIALIKLRKCAKLGRAVRPVCLPTSGKLSGGKCLISGWGASKYGQESKHYPKCLQQGQVTIKKRSKCKNIYKDKGYNYNSNVMLCAGGANGIDACQGDSGGPLVCKNRRGHTLVGLTSWGVKCGKVKYPGVYTRLSRFMKWMYLKIKLEYENKK